MVTYPPDKVIRPKKNWGQVVTISASKPDPRVQGLICLPKLIIPPRGPLVKLYCILLLKNRECRVPFIATESLRVLKLFCSPLTRDLRAKGVKSKKESKQLIIKFYVKKGKENQPDVRGRRINRFQSR